MPTCANCFGTIPKTHKLNTCATCNAEMHVKCSAKCKSCGKPLCDTCLIAHEELCSDCESKAVVEIDVVRRSHLELYDKCPYAFKLEVVDGGGSAQTIYTQSGIDLHELFDEYSKHDEGDADEMYARFIKEYECNYPEEWYNDTHATRAKMDERYRKNIKGFFDLRAKLGPPVITEEQIVFSVHDNLPKVSITMDRIDEEDGEYVLGDYKTGKVMVGKKLTTDLQAPLYILAVKQHYGKPVKRFDFYYLSEEKIRSFVRSEEDEDIYICNVVNREYKVSLEETKREVRDRLAKIQKGLFQIQPNQKPYGCKWCQFYQTQCEGCDTEIWHQTRGGY